MSVKLNGELYLQFGPEVGLKARIRVNIHGGPNCRIDVSKDKLVIYFQDKFYELPNDRQAFEEIRKILPKGCKRGIESTGVYHINLTKYLGKEYDVRIINSFILKKFKDFGGRRATRMMLKNLLN